MTGLYKCSIRNYYQKMIFFIFLISKNLLNAFNEDLTAVHYSIVTPGIDEEIKPGIFELIPSRTRLAPYGKKIQFKEIHILNGSVSTAT